MKDPWPWPADTALERARRIANSYRAALLTVAPDLCAQLDSRAVELGQGWVKPLDTDVAELDEALTAEQIGALLCVAPRTVRMWGRRGHITNVGEFGKPLYTLRSVLDYQAEARRARSA